MAGLLCVYKKTIERNAPLCDRVSPARPAMLIHLVKELQSRFKELQNFELEKAFHAIASSHLIIHKQFTKNAV